MKCKACARDMANGVAQSHGAVIACQRLRQKSKQWWEKEPGWFWREFRPTSATAWHASFKPRQVLSLVTATPKQIVAELTRQSKRLAGQPDITFEEAA